MEKRRENIGKPSIFRWNCRDSEGLTSSGVSASKVFYQCVGFLVFFLLSFSLLLHPREGGELRMRPLDRSLLPVSLWTTFDGRGQKGI